MSATGNTHAAAVHGRTWLEYAGTSLYTTWVTIEPERAFAYVADMTRHNEWAVHQIMVTPAEPGPVHLGSRYTSSGRQGGRDWPSELEVTVYEPPTRFEFTATGGPIASPSDRPHRHQYRFSPERGGTRIEVQRTDPFEGTVKLLLTPIVKRIAARIRRQTLENLRSRLEDLATDLSP